MNKSGNLKYELSTKITRKERDNVNCSMDVHGVGSRYFLVTIADCSLAYLNSASFPHGRGMAPGRAVFLLA